MTPEQLREAAAVMLAAADGKKIQRRFFGNKEWEDKNGLNTWDFTSVEYRHKAGAAKGGYQIALFGMGKPLCSDQC